LREAAVSEEIWTEVRVRAGNTIYKGHYRVQRDEVVVHRTGGKKSARLGAAPAQVLAEKLLRELVAEGKA
jgi:hypothetical protein